MRLLPDISVADLGMARQVLGLPWMVQGPTPLQFEVLNILKDNFENDPALAHPAFGLPWVTGTPGTLEIDALNALRTMSFQRWEGPTW